MANYKNIPVDEDTYIAVKTIAIANGLGERGVGAQVKQWAVRELPPCEHPKQPVSIELYPNEFPEGGPMMRQGFFCATCNRVYQRVIEAVAVETATVETEDPYGQPAQHKTKKRRTRVGRDF